MYQTETIYELEIDPKHVGVISSEANQSLPLGLKTANGKVRFFIHPKALDLFGELLKLGKLRLIKAHPTSSPRTFFVDDFMVKLSIPQKINGAIRTVYPLQMSRATLISRVLSEIPSQEAKDAGFGFLPEPFALYDKTPGSPFGFMVREIPREFVHGSTTLVPILSYTAKHPEGSLLEKDAQLAKWTPQVLVEKEIIPALIKSFALAARYGVVLEAHQQNTMLEIDERGRFTGRVFYRDLDGARLDFKLREYLGLKNEDLLNRPEADWIFDLEGLQKIRVKTLVAGPRPKAWSPVVESAFKTYLLGSSIFLLKESLKSLRDFSSLGIDKVIAEELSALDLNATPHCRQVFARSLSH